jgi:hypothetical protein
MLKLESERMLAQTATRNPLREFDKRLRRLLAKVLIQAYRDIHSDKLDIKLSAWEFLLSEDARIWLEWNNIEDDPWRPVEEGKKLGSERVLR